MTPVTDERCTQASENDEDRDPDRQQETSRVDVHSSERINCRSPSDCETGSVNCYTPRRIVARTQQRPADNQDAEECIKCEEDMAGCSESHLDYLQKRMGTVGIHLHFGCNHAEHADLDGSTGSVPPSAYRH